MAVYFKVFLLFPPTCLHIQPETETQEWCRTLLLSHLPFKSDGFSFSFLDIYFYLFIWRHWDPSCSMWDLVPWPGIKPSSAALGTWSLGHWTTREVPLDSVSLVNAPSLSSGFSVGLTIWGLTHNWSPNQPSHREGYSQHLLHPLKLEKDVPSSQHSTSFCKIIIIINIQILNTWCLHVVSPFMRYLV